MARHLNPPFGTYALPQAREKLRLKAGAFKDTRWGRAMISHYRNRALKGLNEPFDVDVAPGVKARLYPSQNRCEKRAFAGVQVWDLAERTALENAVKTCTDDNFVFFDVGANVGLYSVFAAHYCMKAEKEANIYAVEPAEIMAERLSDNLAASNFKVQVIRAAVSSEPGTGHLGGGDVNRGETRLMDGDKGELVIIDTLARIALTHGVTKIHALKLDVEGHDLKALTAFFETAPKSLFPGLLILETGRAESSPLIDLCTGRGYALEGRYGLNAIMTLKDEKTDE